MRKETDARKETLAAGLLICEKKWGTETFWSPPIYECIVLRQDTYMHKETNMYNKRRVCVNKETYICHM